MIDEQAIVWVAGVLDARGHIEISQRHGKPQPRLSVTTRRTSLLVQLAEFTGTKVSHDDRGYERRACGEHCIDKHVHAVRNSSKWRVDSSRATIVLHNVLPFMRAERADALEALRVGMQAFPASKGNTAAQMTKLGWRLPILEETS